MMPFVLWRIIDFEETHLTKLSEGTRVALVQILLPWSSMDWDRSIWGPWGKVTCIFGSNPLKPMPSILIHNTQSKNEDSMWIKPSWVQGLPDIVDQRGFRIQWSHKYQFPSCCPQKRKNEQYSVQQDNTFYKTLYPNLAPKLLSFGVFYFQQDWQPVRKELQEWEGKICKVMHNIWVHLYPGLPNTTFVS